jgi:hypothetical protein
MLTSVLKASLLVTMIATAVVLLIGVFIMIKGGTLNATYGNKLMRWRVFLQGFALALFALLLYTKYM